MPRKACHYAKLISMIVCTYVMSSHADFSVGIDRLKQYNISILMFHFE